MAQIPRGLSIGSVCMVRPSSLESASAIIVPKRVGNAQLQAGYLSAPAETVATEKILTDCLLFLAQNATDVDLRAAIYSREAPGINYAGWHSSLEHSWPGAATEQRTISSAMHFLKHYLRSLAEPLMSMALVKDLLILVEQETEISDPVERALILHMAAHQHLSPEQERILYAIINMLGVCALKNKPMGRACPWIARDFAPILSGIASSMSAPPPGPMFGVSLNELLRRSPSPNRVPWLVQACYESLRPYLTVTEGLFRIAADESEVTALKNALQNSVCTQWNVAALSPHLVAGILQRFFLELPEPLLTHALYDQLLTSVLVATDTAPLLDLLKTLPGANRAVLVTLINSLRLISTHEAVTRMSATNLGIIFGPILLHVPEGKGLDKRALRLQCKVVSSLISLPVEDLHNALVPNGLNVVQEAASVLGCFISHDAQLDFVSGNVELDEKGKLVRMSREVAQLVICSDLPSLSPLQRVLVEFREYLWTKEELLLLLHRRVSTPNARRRPSILDPLLRSLSGGAEMLSPEPLITQLTPPSSLLLLHHYDGTLSLLAKLIFKADASLYLRIPHVVRPCPSKYANLTLAKELMKGRYKAAHSHFSRFADHYNKLATWISTEVVLQGKDLARRTQALRAAIHLCDLLRANHDYSGAYAVFGGLSHSAVSRLAKTWSSLHQSDNATWAEMNTFFSTDSDWKHVRQAMAVVGTDTPVVPYLGMYTRRMTVVEETNQTTVAGHVNMTKLEILYNIVTEFKLHQHNCGLLDLESTSSLVLPMFTEDHLFAQSLLLEARQPSANLLS